MKSINHKNSVLFCIGNVARQDDGLGWAFADAIEKSGLFKGEIYRNYQLNIEDAETASNAETVIFVDAFQGEAQEGFIFEECEADGKISFTTHALSPYAILALTNDLFQKFPQAFVLKIKGESW
jgi:hydrogenase maturation protease